MKSDSFAGSTLETEISTAETQPLQLRKTSGCAANYMGMDLNACDDIRTHLYAKSNASASIVWLIEPVFPEKPTIASVNISTAVVTGNTLTVVVAPPTITGLSGGCWRLAEMLPC